MTTAEHEGPLRRTHRGDDGRSTRDTEPPTPLDGPLASRLRTPARAPVYHYAATGLRQHGVDHVGVWREPLPSGDVDVLSVHVRAYGEDRVALELFADAGADIGLPTTAELRELRAALRRATEEAAELRLTLAHAAHLATDRTNHAADLLHAIQILVVARHPDVETSSSQPLDEVLTLAEQP